MPTNKKWGMFDMPDKTNKVKAFLNLLTIDMSEDLASLFTEGHVKLQFLPEAVLGIDPNDKMLAVCVETAYFKVLVPNRADLDKLIVGNAPTVLAEKLGKLLNVPRVTVECSLSDYEKDRPYPLSKRLDNEVKAIVRAYNKHASNLWTEVWWGKHSGKSLPQIIFEDLGYFLWGIRKNMFEGKGILESEALELYEKIQSIRVPQTHNDGIPRVVEYIIGAMTKAFERIELVPENRPEHRGGSQTFRSSTLDLTLPSRIKSNDRTCNKEIIRDLKQWIMKLDPKVRLKRASADAFFADAENFV